MLNYSLENRLEQIAQLSGGLFRWSSGVGRVLAGNIAGEIVQIIGNKNEMREWTTTIEAKHNDVNIG